MKLLGWWRVDPLNPCVSPDGHDHYDVMSMGSVIPVYSRCLHCGQSYGIAESYEDEDDSRGGQPMTITTILLVALLVLLLIAVMRRL